MTILLKCLLVLYLLIELMNLKMNFFGTSDKYKGGIVNGQGFY